MLSGLSGFLSADYEADEAPLTDEEEWPISQEELRKKISKQVGEIIQMLIGLNSDGGFFLPCRNVLIHIQVFIYFALAVTPPLISGFVLPSCVTSLIFLF